MRHLDERLESRPLSPVEIWKRMRVAPETYATVAVRARNLSRELGVPIYIVQSVDSRGRVSWSISRSSPAERLAYEEKRIEELRTLFPDRYPRPLTSEERREAELQKQDHDFEDEIRRLQEHDRSGTEGIYGEDGYQAIFFPEESEEWCVDRS